MSLCDVKRRQRIVVVISSSLDDDNTLKRMQGFLKYPFSVDKVWQCVVLVYWP